MLGQHRRPTRSHRPTWTPGSPPHTSPGPRTAPQPGGRTRVRQDRPMPDRTAHDRPVVDRAGAAAAAGISVPRIDQLYRDRATTGFPERIPDTRHWYHDEITAWAQEHRQAKKAELTEVDHSGDPDELVTTPEVARILGYHDRRSLNHSSVWPRLLDHVDQEEQLPSGRARRHWRRRTVWAIADARTGKHGTGRPTGHQVDRGGDPNDLLGATQAARALGYAPTSPLPAALLELADDIQTGPAGRQRRRWRRSTLWTYADTHNPS
jgi:hypothetical protein